MITAVVVHMILEAIGGLIMLYALGFCSHTRHKLTVWFALALTFSIITVQLIG